MQSQHGALNRIVLLSAIVIAVAVVFSLTFIFLRPYGRNLELHKPSSPVEKATLAYVNTTHAVLPGVALQQGYYLQEGLDVTSREHSFGKSALADMLQGNADFATVADPPIMMEIMKGEKIYIIATIQTSNKDNAIVAMKDAEIFKPGDLKGKTIGTTFETTSDFFVDAFLISNQISLKDIEKIDLKPEQLQDALVNGHVDAVSAFQPFLLKMQRKLGGQAISFYDESIYTWTFSIVAKQEYVHKNPEKVRKLLRALVKAEDFVKQNTVKAQKIVADYSKMEIDLVQELWPGIRFEITLDQLLVLALEDESSWAIHHGFVANKEIPDFIDYFYFDAMQSVKPEAIKIFGREISGR